MQGDCIELMGKLPDNSIDCVIADIPYGTTACSWDIVIPFEPMWEHLRRITKLNSAIILFGSQPFTSRLIMSNLSMFKYCWLWKSNKAANFAQAPYMPLKICEDVLVFSQAKITKNSKNKMKYNPQGMQTINKLCTDRGPSNHRPNRSKQGQYIQDKTGYPNQVLEFNKLANPMHPTQKPIDLIQYLIKTYSDENDLILDFTAGSCTAGVAAKQLGRDYICMEKEQEYCDIGQHRLDGVNLDLFVNIKGK